VAQKQRAVREFIAFYRHCAGKPGFITLPTQRGEPFTQPARAGEDVNDRIWIDTPRQISSPGNRRSRYVLPVALLYSYCSFLPNSPAFCIFCFRDERMPFSRNLPNSSTLRTTTTARPCFSIATGSARAVSRSSPNVFFASLADIVFIVAILIPDSVHNGYFGYYLQPPSEGDFS
jgi:hypothetical protein